MELNLDKLKQFIEVKFNGNRSKFASGIGIDRGQLSKILNTGTCAGKDFFTGLYCFCKKEGLNFDDFIFFTK